MIEVIKISETLKAKSSAVRISLCFNRMLPHYGPLAKLHLLFSYLDFRVCLACYPPESFRIICLTCIWFKFVDTSFHSLQKPSLQDRHFKLREAQKHDEGWNQAHNWLNLLTSCGPNLEAIGSNATFLILILVSGLPYYAFIQGQGCRFPSLSTSISMTTGNAYRKKEIPGG